jgi:hypothetical protein
VKILTNDTEGYRALLTSWQRARSIARENDTLDLMAGFPDLGIRGLEPFTANDKTGDLLASLVDGSKVPNAAEWRNIVEMVRMSPSWALGLAVLRFDLPERVFA